MSQATNPLNQTHLACHDIHDLTIRCTEPSVSQADESKLPAVMTASRHCACPLTSPALR